MAAKRRVAHVIELIAVMLALGSVVVFIGVSLASNTEPHLTPFRGSVTILEAASDSVHEVRMFANSNDAASGHPVVSYDASICGTGSFSGFLLLADDARFEQLAVYDGPKVAGSWYLQPLVNAPRAFRLDSTDGQAFKIFLPHTEACLPGSNTNADVPPEEVGGTVISFSGRASRPIQYAGSFMGLHGADNAIVWPAIGVYNPIGIWRYGAGVTYGGGALDGQWVRPRVFSVLIVNKVQADIQLFTARPAPLPDSILDWRRWGPVAAFAEFKEPSVAERWQRWVVVASTCFAIGASVLAAMALDRIRLWKGGGDEAGAIRVPAAETRVATSAPSPDGRSCDEVAARPQVRGPAKTPIKRIGVASFSALAVCLAWGAWRRRRVS